MINGGAEGRGVEREASVRSIQLARVFLLSWSSEASEVVEVAEARRLRRETGST